jgi:hypothetical protein
LGGIILNADIPGTLIRDKILNSAALTPDEEDVEGKEEEEEEEEDAAAEGRPL